MTLVVLSLRDGSHRFGEIAHVVAGVSQKMLTQTLCSLERDGLLRRTVTPSVPVRVDDELTPLGVSLLPVVQAVEDWAEAHMTEVDRARTAYDRRAA